MTNQFTNPITEDDIAKLWGGNVLRILEAAETAAAYP